MPPVEPATVMDSEPPLADSVGDGIGPQGGKEQVKVQPVTRTDGVPDPPE